MLINFVMPPKGVAGQRSGSREEIAGFAITCYPVGRKPYVANRTGGELTSKWAMMIQPF